MGDIRQHLKTAVAATPVPPWLQTRVRARLQAPAWTPARLLPVTALLVACAALVTVYEKGYLPIAFGSQANYIASLSANMPELVKVGLGDHIHCAVFRKYPKDPPTPAEFVESIGPKYAELVRIVQHNTPPGYRMLLAHECHYRGRGFIHLTLGAGDHLISLMITPRRTSEALRAPLWQGSAESYQVAAFASPRFVVYVASDLSAGQNAALLAAMVPEVKTLLEKI